MVNVGHGEWVGNSVVFATETEARACARDLMSRWMLVIDTRADPTDALVNYKWDEGRMVTVQ
jgi:hypothetical protein